MKVRVLLLSALCLIGCSTNIVIRDARTGQPGEIKPLKTYLADAKDGVLLIFVHGVADHCPGYALDDNVGWLNEETRKSLGLRDIPAGELKQITLQDPAHWNDYPDAASTYTVARRRFGYTTSEGEVRSVTAVEITWSGLTRWVKTKQLGFDLTEPIVKSKHDPAKPANTEDDLMTCIEPVPAQFDQKRVLVNRILKEQTLDRSLADAVLYIGSYGIKINFAMADSLCRSLTDDFTDAPCDWATAALNAEKPRTVLFVTHSLGSRIVYDTLLEMEGRPLRRDAAPVFDHGSTSQQRTSVASNILAHNAATFMMANQLPLLGLTFVPPGYRSKDRDTPYLRIAEFSLGDLLVPREGPVIVPAHPDPLEATAQLNCGPNPISCAALFRPAQSTQPMDVVAFSDTNDLLTYAVPPSYTEDNGYLRFQFTNVFVHNSTMLLWLFENPGPAHTNYFVNNTVRKAIVCGGRDTALAASCK